MPRTRYTDEQKQAAAQAALDVMIDRDVSQNAACAHIAKPLKVTARTIGNWAQRFDVDLSHANAKARARTKRANEARRQYTLERRREQNDDLQAALSGYAIAVRQEAEELVVTGGVPTAQQASRLNSLALAHAILHDKRTAIEELERERGGAGDDEQLDALMAEGEARVIKFPGRAS